MVTIPPGYRVVTTPEGDKITNDGQTFFLIDPSDAFLRDTARASLRIRSVTVDTATFPNGRWERINDYDARTRRFDEFDSQVGGSLINTEFEQIPDEEVNLQFLQEQFTQGKADINAATTINDLRIILRRIVRFLERQFIVDAAAPVVQLGAADETVSVGNTVTVLVGISQIPPTGLAGFILQAQVEDPSILKIIDATFNATNFPLNSHTPDPVDGPTLTAIAGTDLNSQLNGGETNVLLTRIVVEGLAPGQTRIFIGRNSLDDDDGEPIITTILTPTVTVTP